MASVDLQEKANFTRLSRLLVDKGTEALRNTFDTIHPPVSLPGVLATNKTSLQKLKPRVINNSQWDLLFPPSGNPPDSKTFDVTLLTVLFRNICGFSSTGWSVMPPDTDRSTQANITRIKCYRNQVIAHVTTTRVDNSTFQSLWKKIAQAIVELGVSQSDVDEIKTSSLGPEDENYVEILSQLRGIECILDHLTRALEEKRPESDEDILRKLAKHNFKNRIKRKVNFFLPGTREWLLREVDEWFCISESDSRIKLITAGPGFGKSVFAAKICEDFEKNGKLAACHFCDFSNSNLRDPMAMLESLASQMCKSVPGFKEKLLDQLKRPHQVQNLKDAFLIYLQNPLDELEIKEPRLVVIDGLDESAADNKNEIAHLIAEYFPYLPEYIKILVTSRPEISVADLKLTDDQKTDISNVHNNNNLDLELYFKECFPSLVGREVDERELSDDFYEDHPYLYRVRRNGTITLLSIFVAKCQGSFLYAYHFQSGLKACYDLEKITNNNVKSFLPEGLHSIYEQYFKRLEDELNTIKHEKFDVLNILAMLAASEGPLPLTFVAQAFGLAPDCRETKDIINKINETVSCLLYVSDDLLTVFHKSFIDWLLAKGYKDHQYTVKVDDGHRSLWLLCEKVFKEIVENVRSGREMKFTNNVKYALKHGLKHLQKCEIEEDDSLILFGKLETAFNIAGRKEVPFFPGNEETFLTCAFSPNGKKLVTSDGFVNFAGKWNKPVKVLDVRDVNRPVMINLPGIQPEMEVEISPGGAFISGCNKNKCYIWKRNTEKPTSYEVFYHRDAGRSRQTIKLSPKEDVLAFYDYKGDMVFLRLSIPQNHLLDDIKRSAVVLWDDIKQRKLPLLDDIKQSAVASSDNIKRGAVVNPVFDWTILDDTECDKDVDPFFNQNKVVSRRMFLGKFTQNCILS
ncbi:uncharacterized protein LOC114535028 [Dendronephthya gigantea]|uniref:uncharacterized protein LOC114535028 n=1 Tax=Dendronephthya gigantea TaxID=151771 RepID=UPI0010691089|nr:uncharacterized protein LOC114535028 [Dendronephthya gigantea]